MLDLFFNAAKHFNLSLLPPMFIPPAFAEDRVEVLHHLVRTHPFGTLVTHGVNGLNATQIPFFIVPGTGGPITAKNNLWLYGGTPSSANVGTLRIMGDHLVPKIAKPFELPPLTTGAAKKGIFIITSI